MNTWDYSFWSALVQISILLVAALVGNTIRRLVPFVRKSLLPSAVVGGIIILLFKFIPAVNNFIDATFMEGVAYHCLAFGFIAIALKSNVNKSDGTGIVIKTGAVVVGTYLIQGIVGIVITILLSLVISGLIPAAGLLLPLGFGQGPGQALNFGTTYAQHGLFEGASFGLTIATVGFLVACIVGVIYLNILKRKNRLLDVVEGEYSEVIEQADSPNDIPLSDSIDKFTVQVAIVMGTYLITFLLMWGITAIIDTGIMGNFGEKTLKPLIWGFNFLFGTLFALLVKKIIQLLRKRNIMKHDYINNYMMNRISGFVFDMMILAGISAIKFDVIQKLWLPLLLLCVFGTAVTFVYLNIVCKRLYPTYRYQAMVSLFGMLTGTASTGMILLREIDPKFQTPAANNLIMQSVPAMAFGFPMLLLAGYAAGGMTASLITLAALVGLFALMNVIVFVKFKRKNVKGGVAVYLPTETSTAKLRCLPRVKVNIFLRIVDNHRC